MDEVALFLKYQSEKEGLAINIPSLIKEKRFEGQPFVLLSIVDERGDLRSSSQEPFVFSNIGDREHFLVHKEEDIGLFISKPVLGRSSGKWSIQLSRRINKSDGSFGGVVVVSIDPNYFAEFYRQVNLGAQSSIAIIGREGVVRVRQTGQEMNFSQDYSQRIKEYMSSGTEGSYCVEGTVDGIRRIYSFLYLKDYPLIVVVGVAETEVFKELNQRIVDYYWICGSMSGVIILFVGLLLSGITRRRQAENQVRLLLDSTAEAIYGIDMNGNCTFTNRSCLRMLGYEGIEQLFGKNMHDLIHHSYPDGRVMRSEECKIYKAFRAGKGMHVDDEVLWKADGTSFPAEYWSYPQMMNDKVVGAVVTFTDITERKIAEEAIRSSRARYQALIEQSSEALMLVDAQTQEVVEVNRRFTELFGYSLPEDAPFFLNQVVNDSKLNLDQKINETLMQKGFLPTESRVYRHKNGTEVPVERALTVIRLDGKDYFLSSLRDLTEERRHQQELEETNALLMESQQALIHQATHDSLTGLLNRRAAMEIFTKEIERNKRNAEGLAIGICDIDHFKAINDTWGHQAGDEVLHQLAQILTSIAREYDTIARIGGEEFLMIIPLKNEKDAEFVFERFCNEIANNKMKTKGGEITVTVSIGVTCAKADSEMNKLLSEADEAMYQAKEQGRNRVVYFKKGQCKKLQ